MTERTIHLHGALGTEFGESFRFAVETAGEAIRALNANFPGRFIEALREGSFHVIRGDLKDGMPLEEDHLNTFRLGNADLHIIPAIKGSSPRGKGGIKAIIGVALIGVAIFASGGLAGGGLFAGLGQTAIPLTGNLGITYGQLAMVGALMAVGGASQMLAPKEKPKDETKRDDSFAFSGPINTNDQGNPVPLIYGRVMTGGMPISSGIDIEDIGTYRASVGSGIPGHNQISVNGQIVDILNRLGS